MFIVSGFRFEGAHRRAGPIAHVRVDRGAGCQVNIGPVPMGRFSFYLGATQAKDGDRDRAAPIA